MALNGRKYQFAKNFALSGDGEQAAIKAGYSTKTAAFQAQRLLKDKKIIAQINHFHNKYQPLKKTKQESCCENEKTDGILRRQTMSKLQEIVDISLDSGKPSAAVSAVMAMVKLAGLEEKEKEDENSNLEIIIKKYNWEEDGIEGNQHTECVESAGVSTSVVEGADKRD